MDFRLSKKKCAFFIIILAFSINLNFVSADRDIGPITLAWDHDCTNVEGNCDCIKGFDVTLALRDGTVVAHEFVEGDCECGILKTFQHTFESVIVPDETKREDVQASVRAVDCSDNESDDASIWLSAVCETPHDVNGDNNVDITDVVALLEHLFEGADIPCKDSADANGDGKLSITDAIKILEGLFGGKGGGASLGEEVGKPSNLRIL